MPHCMQVNRLNNVLIFLTNQQFFLFFSCIKYLFKNMWLFFYFQVLSVQLFHLVGFIVFKYRIIQLATVFSNTSNYWLKTIWIYDSILSGTSCFKSYLVIRSIHYSEIKKYSTISANVTI